jgi:hypothetical protein
MPEVRGDLVFQDDFEASSLDLTAWSPYYLPHWSSRAASAATYELSDSCLTLSIPPEQGLWCEGDHKPDLRVSGIQTGNYSGPVGSTIGQQPYREGLVVREEQEPFWGWTPNGGYVELRAKAQISRRSMVSLWMVGLEDQPERCGEICVMEVFGDQIVSRGTTPVGMGLKRLRDPSMPQDFEVVPLPIDLREFHTYSVEWAAGEASFFVDGAPIRNCQGAPSYPLQLMLAVFDFPDGSDADFVPSFTVDHVRGWNVAEQLVA